MFSVDCSDGNECHTGGSFCLNKRRLILFHTASTKANHICPNRNTAKSSRKIAPISAKSIVAPYFLAKRFMKKSVNRASSSSWDT